MQRRTQPPRPQVRDEVSPRGSRDASGQKSKQMHTRHSSLLLYRGKKTRKIKKNICKIQRSYAIATARAGDHIRPRLAQICKERSCTNHQLRDERSTRLITTLSVNAACFPVERLDPGRDLTRRTGAARAGDVGGPPGQSNASRRR